MAACDELCSQGAVILDNAVVDHRQASRAIWVGMRVSVGGDTVSGPPRVGNPECPSDGRLTQALFQPDDLALSLPDDQSASVHNSQSRRVISTVLEAFQARDEDLGRFAGTDVADYSAH